MAKQNILGISIGIGIFCLMCYASGLPMDVPRYNKLGANPPQYNNSREQARNNTYVQTTDRLGTKPTQTTTTIAPLTPAPQFEYALLGQDPEDQRWYRVSLTPTGGKQTGYHAEFATRTSPPIDAQLTHKHDKTIKELLEFLEKSEEHNLLKVYGQLVASDEDEEEKLKKEVDNELEVGQEPEIQTKRQIRFDGGRPVLIVGELPATATPTTGQNASDSSMVNNFVYFIKGLK